MQPLDVVLAPWRAAQLVARAADDLHAVAERARREPDPVEEVRRDLRTLLTELASLIVVAREIHDGGEDLRQTAERLDRHTVVLTDGGAELTAVAHELNAALQPLRAALPQLLSALGTVEDLESSVEKVAETVEPLQGVTRGVGRLTGRRAHR